MATPATCTTSKAKAIMLYILLPLTAAAPSSPPSYLGGVISSFETISIRLTAFGGIFYDRPAVTIQPTTPAAGIVIVTIAFPSPTSIATAAEVVVDIIYSTIAASIIFIAATAAARDH
jgi:hypothetical protein